MIFIATPPASAMVDGIDRSTLPGPVVMTNIWPMPTITVKVAKDSAAVMTSPPPLPSVKRMVASQTASAPRNESSQGWLPMRAAAAFIVASRSLMRARRASTTISTAPWAPICQSGEMRMKMRNEPVRVSVTAPITAPMGETRPPTNSPPPRITPAIASSV